VFNFVDSDDTGRAFDLSAGDSERLEYLVKAISKGDPTPAAAGDVAGAIDTALQGGSITATGYTVWGVTRARRVRFLEWDPERIPYWHVGAIYQLYILKN
jgi:hypothetical protein